MITRVWEALMDALELNWSLDQGRMPRNDQELLGRRNGDQKVKKMKTCDRMLSLCNHNFVFAIAGLVTVLLRRFFMPKFEETHFMRSQVVPMQS